MAEESAAKFHGDLDMFHRLADAMPLDREMSNGEIYHLIQRDGKPLLGEWRSTVRRTLQANCAEAPQFGGGKPYFSNVSSGWWTRIADRPRLEDL